MAEATVYNVTTKSDSRGLKVSKDYNYRTASPASVASDKAAQLQALLLLSRNAADGEFKSLSDEHREHLLGLAADLALEVRALCDLAVEVSE